MAAIKKTFLFLVLFSAWPSLAVCQQIDRPSAASDYIQKGNACYDKKQYSEALSLYTQAVNLDPKNITAAFAHYRSATALEAMGKHADAISECSKAIAIDPFVNKGLAYLLRGFAYEKTGKYVEAVSDYSSALLITPECKDAWVRRQKLMAGLYAKFGNEGAIAFYNGLAAYYGRKDASARKDLAKAASSFAYAMSFDIGDKTAFAMANFTKGLTLQIMSREILDIIKPDSSDRETARQLASAYYVLAVTNAYYEKTFSLLKNEKLKNSLKELKAENDKNIAIVRLRIIGIESRSEKYIKAADIEARCIVNFDAASQSIAAGDHDGAKRILGENDSMVSDLRKFKSPNAEGIRYLTNAYTGINTIFSYPITDRSWLKENKAALNRKINDCLKDLGHAKGALVTKELVNNCSILSKNVSNLKDMFEKIGEKQ